MKRGFNIFKSSSEEITMKYGERLAKFLRPGDIVCLQGDLGAGKTTFVKGIANGLKIDNTEVHSPTFTLMNIYQGKVPLYHFDCYRLEENIQLGLAGYEEFLYGRGISVVEWPDRLYHLMPKNYIEITLKHVSLSERKIYYKVKGEQREALRKLKLS